MQAVESFCQEVYYIAASWSVHAQHFGVFVAQRQTDGPFALIFILIQRTIAAIGGVRMTRDCEGAPVYPAFEEEF